MTARHLITTKPFALLAALALVLGLAAAPAQASDLWLHVTVVESEENANVSVNLPISLVEKVLDMVPDEEMRDGKIRLGDDAEFSADDLRQLLAAVRDTPDMDFVTVKTDNETVKVSKAGDMILVHTTESSEHGADVNVRVPLVVVEALLDNTEEGELNIGAAIRALAQHGEGEIATISADNAKIRVWVDDQPEAR